MTDDTNDSRRTVMIGTRIRIDYRGHTIVVTRLTARAWCAVVGEGKATWRSDVSPRWADCAGDAIDMLDEKLAVSSGDPLKLPNGERRDIL